MELKRHLRHAEIITNLCSNRTLMELKPRISDLKKEGLKF